VQPNPPLFTFSLLNLKEHSLIEVLQSPFFEKVRAVSAAEAANHKALHIVSAQRRGAESAEGIK
jgi:hypothetical protein